MRIHVTGDCGTAKTLRGHLRRHDFHMTAHEPDWVIHIEETEGAAGPAIEGVGGELEQAILWHLRKEPGMRIELRPGCSTLGNRELRVLIPAEEALSKAAETALFRGILRAAKQPGDVIPEKRWWETFLKGRSK